MLPIEKRLDLLEEYFEKKFLSLEKKLDFLENIVKLNEESLKNLENVEYQLSFNKTITFG